MSLLYDKYINNAITVLSKKVNSHEALRVTFYILKSMQHFQPYVFKVSPSKSIYIRFKSCRGTIRVSDHECFVGKPLCFKYTSSLKEIDLKLMIFKGENA